MPSPIFLFFVLVGLLTVAIAARFALRPAERTLTVLRPLSAATLFASLAAFCAGITNGTTALAQLLERTAGDPGASDRAWRLALGGFGESPIALIIGFSLLTVTWLLVAVGLHRQA